jgi:hypothetical protein
MRIWKNGGETMRKERLDEVRLKEMLKEAENFPDEEISGETRAKIAIEATEKMLKTIKKTPLENTVKYWGPIYDHNKIEVAINEKQCGPRVENDQDSTMDIHASIVRDDGEQTVEVLSPGETLSVPVSTHRYVWAAIAGLGGTSQYAFGKVDY